MASLIGAGGTATLNGTAQTAALPGLLASFPTDGTPVNEYTVKNGDTTSTLILWVQLAALHGAIKAFPIAAGDRQTFKVGLVGNDVGDVKVWLTTLAGATTGSSALVSAGATAGG